MEKLKKVKAATLIWVIFGMVFCSMAVIAAESGRQILNRDLQASIGMPVMTGEYWQKLSEDSKIAFIWGLWSTINIEHYLMNKYPNLKTENFSSKVFEGTAKAPKTVNQTVELIDSYYKNNPDHLSKPVVGVIWALEVKPNLTVGIAGRPLNPND
jgi:hypothetical protein